MIFKFLQYKLLNILTFSLDFFLLSDCRTVLSLLYCSEFYLLGIIMPTYNDSISANFLLKCMAALTAAAIISAIGIAFTSAASASTFSIAAASSSALLFLPFAVLALVFGVILLPNIFSWNSGTYNSNARVYNRNPVNTCNGVPTAVYSGHVPTSHSQAFFPPNHHGRPMESSHHHGRNNFPTHDNHGGNVHGRR